MFQIDILHHSRGLGFCIIGVVCCRGLEKAMDQLEAERGQKAEQDLQATRQAQGIMRTDSAEKDKDVRRVIMREKRSSAWRHLNLNERDVLTALSAICKVPSSSWFPLSKSNLQEGYYTEPSVPNNNHKASSITQMFMFAANSLKIQTFKRLVPSIVRQVFKCF